MSDKPSQKNQKAAPFNSAFDKLAEMKRAMEQKAAAEQARTVEPLVKKGAPQKGKGAPAHGSNAKAASHAKDGAKSSDDGLDFFLRSMEGIQPVSGKSTPAVERPGPTRVRHDAVADSLALADFAGAVDFAGTFSSTDISGVAVQHVPGLNKRVLETLLFTESRPEAELDLHGLRAHVAEARVLQMVRDARREGHRRILIITGKGEDGEGVLRENVPDWLRSQQLSRHVLAFCQAPRAFGGEGALCVLLRRAR